MRLFIAEKPSLARAIADALPPPQRRHQGYIECGGNNLVTWCAGHILELAEPEVYRPEFKTWSEAHLPIVPEEWRLSVTAPDLLDTIGNLLPKASEVVHAGDPDREGQLLVDEVLDHLGYHGKVFRVLINDLNVPAVKKALANLKANADFRGLYDSARARQRADWLFGINLTRLYTLLGRAGGHDGILSVGRVQTPLLGLVVRRDLEIERFKPRLYYLVRAALLSSRGSFLAKWTPPEGPSAVLDEERRLINRANADGIVARCSGQAGKVVECSRDKKAEPPPLPYSLAELQVDAGKRFGLSPKETLEACQALYETHRLVTYPRSDCSYLPEGQFSQAASVLRAIHQNAVTLEPAVAGGDPDLKSRAWSDTRITAHHAIIPTAIARSTEGVPEHQRRLYELIARRYVAQFYRPCVFHQTVLEIDIAGELFGAIGRQPLAEGWRAVIHHDSQEESKDAAKGDDESATTTLPALAVGEAVVVERVTISDKTTSPPKRFTDATLVQAMTGIARFVSDPKIKQLLRESDGIGTPATQAAIIQTLYDRRFIEKTGRQVTSTAIGRALIQVLPPVATSPDMTALWEAAMKKIADGTMSLAAFLDVVLRQLSELIRQGRARGPLHAPGARPCPAPGCRGFVRTRPGPRGPFLACTRYPECRYTVDPSVPGRRRRNGGTIRRSAVKK